MIKIVAEIGINHNGDLNIAKKLIDLAYVAGCDYVKFQKRTPDKCVPEHKKHEHKDTPWGTMTYLEYKHRLEFTRDEYEQIDVYCNERGIGWFASVWDMESAWFMSRFCDIAKIPSALITDYKLLTYTRSLFKTVIMSTGMSTEQEIEDAVALCRPDVIMHTHSAYPAPVDELRLEHITYLKNKYECKTGYSGHEHGLSTTYATVALGIDWIERHITLDHDMWGSDHKSSVDPVGVIKLVRTIRDIEKAMGGN